MMAQLGGLLVILAGCADGGGKSIERGGTGDSGSTADASDSGNMAADGGDSGRAADADDPGSVADTDPCRSQCPLNVENDNCLEEPFESFPALEVTLDEWSTTMCGRDAEAAFPYLLEARCENGTRVLYYGSGSSIERRFYDCSGQFLALETAGDGGQGPTCNDSAYWPERVECEKAEATNVVCGTALFKVGDRVPL